MTNTNVVSFVNREPRCQVYCCLTLEMNELFWQSKHYLYCLPNLQNLWLMTTNRSPKKSQTFLGFICGPISNFVELPGLHNLYDQAQELGYFINTENQVKQVLIRFSIKVCSFSMCKVQSGSEKYSRRYICKCPICYIFYFYATRQFSLSRESFLTEVAEQYSKQVPNIFRVYLSFPFWFLSNFLGFN